MLARQERLVSALHKTEAGAVEHPRQGLAAPAYFHFCVKQEWLEWSPAKPRKLWCGRFRCSSLCGRRKSARFSSRPFQRRNEHGAVLVFLKSPSSITPTFKNSLVGYPRTIAAIRLSRWIRASLPFASSPKRRPLQIQFLSIGTRVCSTLPSGFASRHNLVLH